MSSQLAQSKGSSGEVGLVPGMKVPLQSAGAQNSQSPMDAEGGGDECTVNLFVDSRRPKSAGAKTRGIRKLPWSERSTWLSRMSNFRSCFARIGSSRLEPSA